MTNLLNVNDYCLHGEGHEGCCCDLPHYMPDAVVGELTDTIESLTAGNSELQAKIDAIMWKDISTAPSDLGKYLFKSGNGVVRVDWFHKTVESGRQRWQERPNDRYVAWMEIPS